MGQAQQGRLAPRAAEEREPDRRALGGVARRHDDARIAGLGADRGARPSREDERVESLALHHLVDPVGSRHPEILGAASPIRRGAEPVRGVGRQKEDLTESQHLLGTGLVEADQLSQGSDR